MVATATLRERLGVKTPQEAVPYLNVLVYGEPGSGKTWFAGTAQDHDDTKPILFLDVEGGTTTIRHRSDVDVLRIDSIASLNDAYALLKGDTSGYYKTVILDSLTELQKLDMRDIMIAMIERRPDLDPDVPGMREWGKSSEHMRKLVRAFRDLPCNTIMTALAKSEKDEQDGSVSITPSLPGKLAAEVPGFLDIVGYMHTATEKDELVRRLQTTKTRKIIAKDRTSSLPAVIESPTVPLLWETINSGGM